MVVEVSVAAFFGDDEELGEAGDVVVANGGGEFAQFLLHCFDGAGEGVAVFEADVGPYSGVAGGDAGGVGEAGGGEGEGGGGDGVDEGGGGDVGQVADFGEEEVVFGGREFEHAAADGFPHSAEEGKAAAVGVGVCLRGQDAGGVVKEVTPGGSDAAFFGAGEGVAADEAEGQGSVAPQGGSGGVADGDLDAADVGEEGAGFHPGGELGYVLQDEADAGGKDDEVGVGHGGARVEGGFVHGAHFEGAVE